MAGGKSAEAEALLPPAGVSPDPRIEVIRGRIQADSGNPVAAAETMDQARRRFPDHAASHLFAGIHHWDVDQYDQALECFEETLKIQPKNDLAGSYLALCQTALGDHTAAATRWRDFGFSDNAMFRVRVAEFVERSWLANQSYLGEPKTIAITPPGAVSQRKVLRRFYKRDFRGMLSHVPAAPTDDELSAFLAATAHEMLFHYQAARSYIDPFLPLRSEWPDPLIALNARLMTRRGEIAAAAREFSQIVIMGPEDFGVNYYMGVICLAYEKRAEARQYFLRAFTNYMVDTFEFQWWQIERALLNPGLQNEATSARTIEG